MWTVGAHPPGPCLNVTQLTNQISLRFPGSSTDTVGRFRNSEVYRSICNIIGVEPGQSELIYLCQYLFQHCHSNYILKRQEKRLKSQLVDALEAHKCELLPMLTDTQTSDELRQVYLLSLQKNKPKRENLKHLRRKRHEDRMEKIKRQESDRQLQVPEGLSLECLLNRPPNERTAQSLRFALAETLA